MTLQRQQGQNWNDTANGNGIKWDGIECIEIGMKLNQKWNRPSSVFKQVQVRGVPWPLVQQSLAIGLGKGKLKFSGQQHPQEMIKKVIFPFRF